MLLKSVQIKFKRVALHWPGSIIFIENWNWGYICMCFNYYRQVQAQLIWSQQTCILIIIRWFPYSHLKTVYIVVIQFWFPSYVTILKFENGKSTVYAHNMKHNHLSLALIRIKTELVTSDSVVRWREFPTNSKEVTSLQLHDWTEGVSGSLCVKFYRDERTSSLTINWQKHISCLVVWTCTLSGSKCNLVKLTFYIISPWWVVQHDGPGVFVAMCNSAIFKYIHSHSFTQQCLCSAAS